MVLYQNGGEKMDMIFYILRLKICGLKNIEAPVEFNFYKKTINNDFNPEKYRIKAIYGENGNQAFIPLSHQR